MGRRNPGDGKKKIRMIELATRKPFIAWRKGKGSAAGMTHAKGWLFPSLQLQHPGKMKCNSASIFTQPGPEP